MGSIPLHNKIKSDVRKMLASELVNATPVVLAMWRKMKPLTPELMEKYWKIIKPDVRLFDPTVSEMREWVGRFKTRY